jgi:hypothetical protein
MSWSRKLANPIVLKDGRTIATLGDAREMMLSLPVLHRNGVAGFSRSDRDYRLHGDGVRPRRTSITGWPRGA